MSETATAVETPTPAAPAVETPQPIEDSGSLSDHEAEYSGKRQAKAPKPPKVEAPAAETTATTETPVTEEGAEGRDDKGRFTKRAAKDAATPADVPRIRELTKKLNEERERIAAIERERDEWKSKASTPASQVLATPKVEPTPIQPPAAFTEREPTINDFANEADPYAAYVRALARYDRRKEQHEADQVAAQKAAERQEQERLTQAETTFAKVQSEYQTRLVAFKESHKDFDTLLKASADAPLPPLLQATVLLHDKGPELVYYLLRHPDQLAEMTLLTDGRPVNDQTVAIATRWLTTRAQAASTGSTAPSVPQFTVPRPPNPVQTGPMSTGDDLPDDTSSLAAHEDAFYHGKRKTRR